MNKKVMNKIKLNCNLSTKMPTFLVPTNIKYFRPLIKSFIGISLSEIMTGFSSMHQLQYLSPALYLRHFFYQYLDFS